MTVGMRAQERQSATGLKGLGWYVASEQSLARADRCHYWWGDQGLVWQWMAWARGWWTVTSVQGWPSIRGWKCLGHLECSTKITVEDTVMGLCLGEGRAGETNRLPPTIQLLQRCPNSDVRCVSAECQWGSSWGWERAWQDLSTAVKACCSPGVQLMVLDCGRWSQAWCRGGSKGATTGMKRW